MRGFFRNWYAVTITAAVLLAALFAFGLPLFVAFFRPIPVRIGAVVLVALAWAFGGSCAAVPPARPPMPSPPNWRAPTPPMRKARRWSPHDRGADQAARGCGWTARLSVQPPLVCHHRPAGRGKTTALLNSGLRFPFVEQAVGGIGGTRNLDFWFADEAVLVDRRAAIRRRTATRRSMRRAGTRFWGCSSAIAPRQPINGVLVAIGIDTLVGSDCAAIDAHARAVRRRLVELRRTLETAVRSICSSPRPICSRASPTISTISTWRDVAPCWGLPCPMRTADRARRRWRTPFDEATQAVADRQARRLFEEVDQRRRGMMIGFPAQLRSLRARLMRFADGAFVAGDEAAGVLRGFYMTSGVQEGEALDRILASMAQVYEQPVEAAAPGRGRAYFLNRLLTEVMFPEAGW